MANRNNNLIFINIKNNMETLERSSSLVIHSKIIFILISVLLRACLKYLLFFNSDLTSSRYLTAYTAATKKTLILFSRRRLYRRYLYT
jgi:hypothetical protein